MSTTINNYPIVQKEPVKKKTNSVQYALCASIPAIAGLTHGVYKKIDNTLTSTIEGIKFTSENKLAQAQMAMISNSGAGDAISITFKSGGKALSKILIDNKVNIKRILSQHHTPSGSFIGCLIKLGFNPDNEKIMTFIKSYGIDRLNKDIKKQFGLDFCITLEKDKGRDKPIYKIIHIEETDIKPPKKTKMTGQIEMSFFKKILNPYDKKVLNRIEKIPFGKKFANFMRKTEAPIERFNFKPLRKLYYDKTSMLKGAGVAGILGLTVCAAAKGISTLVSTKKPDNKFDD